MANRFAVGIGAGKTWTNADTSLWSATSGGASGASVPGSGDVAIFDAASGGSGAYAVSLNYSPTCDINFAGISEAVPLLIRSSVRGTQRTITAASVTVANFVHFQDIVGAGAGSWNISGVQSGDAGGNSGITFTPAATQYWQHGASASYNWSDATRWFLATNGGGGAGRVPLPQDTARFDINSFAASGKTVSNNMPRLGGSIDWTGVTNTPTWSHSGTAASIFGSVTLDAGMTLAGAVAYTLEGRGAHTLTSAGKTFANAFTLTAPGGTYTQQDAFVTSSTLSLAQGVWDANDFNFTALAMNDGGSAARGLTMGSGTWTLTGNATNIWFVTATGLTLLSETSTILFTGTLTAARNFVGGGQTYNNFRNSTSGAFAIQFSGNNTFNELRHDSGRTWLNTAGSTQSFATLVVDGVTIGSITAAAHTLTKLGGGTVTAEGATISYSTATGGTFNANFSTDNGNNTGWNFTRIHQAVPTISGSVTLDAQGGLLLEMSTTISGSVTLDFSPTMTLAAAPTISGSVTLSPNAGLILPAVLRIRGSAFLLVDASDLPTGRFSTALKEILASGRAMAVWLLELDIAGTTHRIGFAPYSSRSGDHFSAGLLSLTLGVEALSDRDGRMSPWEAHAEFEDVDRTVSGLLAGANGDDVIGGAARVWLAHPDVLPAHWFQARAGFVARLAPAGALRYAVDLRPNDSPLRADPLPSWTITRSNWPNAHDSAIGEIPAAAYGTHDGANLSVTRGLLPAHLVDILLNVFVLCRGWAKSVTRVCSGDTTLALTTQYVISHPVVHGRRYTVATMTAATWNDTVITWDGEGVEDVGDGSGALIESPLRQLAHALSNYYFGSYLNGDWLPTADEIDADYLTEASDFLDARGIIGSPAITENETGEALIARVLTSNEARAAWNHASAICFRVDETDADPYDAEVVDWRSDDLGEMAITEQDIAVVARVTVEQAIDKASGAPLSTFEVQLPGNDGHEAETLTLTTSAAE